MQELTTKEMQQVSGAGGVRVGSGGANNGVGSSDPTPAGGTRVGSDGAATGGKATPILF
jgi:bacteriocin-like protein